MLLINASPPSFAENDLLFWCSEDEFYVTIKNKPYPIRKNLDLNLNSISVGHPLNKKDEVQLSKISSFSAGWGDSCYIHINYSGGYATLENNILTLYDFFIEKLIKKTNEKALMNFITNSGKVIEIEVNKRSIYLVDSDFLNQMKKGELYKFIYTEEGFRYVKK